jgi:hypothetical protein
MYDAENCEHRDQSEQSSSYQEGPHVDMKQPDSNSPSGKPHVNDDAANERGET